MSTKNKEIKEITDIDLDTGTNLVTENYQLEILGLKDLVDLRKFSRSFLKVDKLLKSIFTGKEDKINKKSAFNKEFGVAQNEVLEGNKLAEILGIEYGGVLNNNNQKVAGKGYYDTANKKIYKCTTNTSINYADAGYFIEVSNNDLLGKLQNLDKIRVGSTSATNNDGSIPGKTLNFNSPISSAIAIHSGGNPLDTNVILEFPASDLNNGLVRFKTSYTSSIQVYYIVVLR